ncbi:MAG: peptide-methionine (S)-S-oxide reductase MsrA [Bacteroidia bacterium]|nr:peptide-methionine (S)-S-oxide reductase MsrA [Bacteroidia bacterium]
MKLVLTATFFVALACTFQSESPKYTPKTQQVAQKDLSGYTKAYFASGCFWCVEAIYESVEGVAEAISGYQGGHVDNPTYELLGTGTTGHAEAVEVYYDPEVVSYKTLVKVFFGSHDPTTLNRQGPDRGTQYRSAIFYQNEKEKAIVDAYIVLLIEDEIFDGEITTEVAPYNTFWPAEKYHQNYEVRNPNNPYVRSVSIPRLNKFKSAFPELLKKEKH